MGWLLYLYAANTSTPVTAYKDTGLTAGLEQPWPLAADSSGMMPSFWLADGSYRARATSKDGSRTFFDLPNVLALGASSGSGGGGSGVDPNAIFQTGDIVWQETQGPRAGWVRDNGRTIGSATSGATERANLDCLALFLFLWPTCSVVGGKGASAAADWAADKQLTLPDKRGYIVGGLDDMGNAAAGRFTGVPVISGGATAAGSVLGENAGALSQGNLPPLNFAVTIPSQAQVTIGVPTSTIQQPGGSGFWGGLSAGPTQNYSGAIPQLTGVAASAGSGAAVNKVQGTVLGTFYRKL